MNREVLVLAAWTRTAERLQFDSQLGCLIGRCGLELLPGESRLECMARELAQWAAALDRPGLEADRKAVFFSASKGGMEAFEAPQVDLGAYLHRYLSSGSGGLIRDALGWSGGGSNTPLACATGAYSMGLAYEAIAEGRLDLALAGAAEASLTPLMAAAFRNLGALSPARSPSGFRGPFDECRGGFALGEGAGALLLASAEGAAALGLEPLARLLGWACNSDAYHLTAPLPGGVQAAKCLRLTLAKAGLEPDEVAYVNAHGTGTPQGDEAEAQALEAVFGPGSHPRVSGVKGATGHTLGAAGAIEAVATVRALERRRVPAHSGCVEPMASMVAKLALGEEDLPLGAALSLSMGFGGHNVALAFGRM